MSKHRAPVRPRYGRVAVLGASLAVTLISVLGGSGLLPRALSGDGDASASVVRDLTDAATSPAAGTPTAPTSSAAPTAPAGPSSAAPSTAAPTAAPETPHEPAAPRADPEAQLPENSGSGKRVVFSENRQRVWLVEEDGTVARTYLVSGSVSDNLHPGTYSVYSRSEDAVGIDDSGTMKWFVRFTRGPSGAAIGFHTIPVDDGRPVQTVAQLGTPLSHGCIRQKLSDALALWEFAPLGTVVVVTP